MTDQNLDHLIGRRMRITQVYEGVVRKSVFDPGQYVIALENGSGLRRIFPDSIRVTESLVPQAWPPQDGDTWQGGLDSSPLYLTGINAAGEWFLIPNRPGYRKLSFLDFGRPADGRQDKSKWHLVHKGPARLMKEKEGK